MRTSVLALAAVICLCAAGTASAAAPQLEVDGKRLVDGGSGKTFVPRGVNWPSFEYACYYGYAYSDEGDPKTTHPTAASARKIASWHINTVRVPLNEACWLGVDGQPAFGDVDGYRAAVQNWVTLLHRAGLAVILDLHWSAPPGVGAEGQRAMPDSRSPAFWTSVATTFKDDRAVIFDLFNEPYSRYDDNDTLVFDLSWDCWLEGGCTPPAVNDDEPLNGATYPATGMRALVEAVRSAGATQPIMLGGRDYANDLGEWLQHLPEDDQLVASFHNYKAQACNTTACWNRTIAPIARQVPVVTGEFGETDCKSSHVNSYMRWADKRGIGYLAWAWWVLPKKGCKELSVLADRSGTPKAPNGTALKSHLAELAGPRISLSGPARQSLDGAIEVQVRCSRACRVRAGGALAIGGQGFRLSTATRSLPARRTRTIAVRIPGRAAGAAASALSAGRRVSASIKVSAGGATKVRRIRLTG